MISGILCGAGILIAAVAFAFCGFDFWKVCAAPDYQESSYTYSADGISSLKLDFKGRRWKSEPLLTIRSM